MPRIVFTPNLKRHVEADACEAAAGTLREVLDTAFAENQKARGYVLDERGAVRKHISIFIDGKMISDRQTLTDPVAADSEVYVMQALSGG